MKRLLFAALLMAVPLVAQQNEQRTTKIISLKYADPQQINALVQMYGLGTNVNGALRVLAVTGTPSQIAAAEAAIKPFDVPPKNIEMVVYFVVGSNQPAPTAPPVPPEVRDVIGQLKNTFTFKDYSMLDTLTLRTRVESFARTTGILNNATPPRLSEFSVAKARIGEDGTIRLDHLHAGLRIPTTKMTADAASKTGTEPANRVEYINTGIDQDIDVKEGQKVVIGRASLDGPEKALFLILTARVIQ
jgi:hypothetical protein